MNIIDSEREFIGLITGLRDMLYRLARSIMFNPNRSFSFTANLGALNVSLNQKRTLALSFTFSATIDRYGFMNTIRLSLEMV